MEPQEINTASLSNSTSAIGFEIIEILITIVKDFIVLIILKTSIIDYEIRLTNYSHGETILIRNYVKYYK